MLRGSFPREGKKWAFSLKHNKILIQYQILTYLSWFSSLAWAWMPAVSQIHCLLACILDYPVKNIGTSFSKKHGKPLQAIWRMMKTAESFAYLWNNWGKGKAAVQENRGEQENPVFADTSFLTANRHGKWCLSVFSRPMSKWSLHGKTVKHWVGTNARGLSPVASLQQIKVHVSRSCIWRTF